MPHPRTYTDVGGGLRPRPAGFGLSRAELTTIGRPRFLQHSNSYRPHTVELDGIGFSPPAELADRANAGAGEGTQRRTSDRRECGRVRVCRFSVLRHELVRAH